MTKTKPDERIAILKALIAATESSRLKWKWQKPAGCSPRYRTTNKLHENIDFSYEPDDKDGCIATFWIPGVTIMYNIWKKHDLELVPLVEALASFLPRYKRLAKKLSPIDAVNKFIGET